MNNFVLLFLDVSGGEILLILLVAFVVFGPKKMTEIAGKIGRIVNQIKKTSENIKNDIANETKGIKSGIEKETDSLKSGIENVTSSLKSGIEKETNSFKTDIENNSTV